MADNKYIDVEIITPQKTIYVGKAMSVNVPGSQAPFQMLYNHAPIVSNLDDGIIKLVDENNKTLKFAITSGFMENNDNKLSVLISSAAKSDDVKIDAINTEIETLSEEYEKAVDKADKNIIKSKLIFAENKKKIVE